MADQRHQEHRQRDSVALLMMGIFFAIFAVLVLLGCFWEERNRGMVVNIVAGLTLMGVGVGMIVFARRLGRSDATSGPGEGV